jgi:hypothetical protein
VEEQENEAARKNQLERSFNEVSDSLKHVVAEKDEEISVLQTEVTLTLNTC